MASCSVPVTVRRVRSLTCLTYTFLTDSLGPRLIDYIWMLGVMKHMALYDCGGGGLETYIRAVCYHVAPRVFQLFRTESLRSFFRFDSKTLRVNGGTPHARAEPSFTFFEAFHRLYASLPRRSLTLAHSLSRSLSLRPTTA